MKKTLFLVILFAVFGASSSYAKPYVSGSIGLGLEGNAVFDGGDFKLDNSAVFNGAIGCNLKPVRVELGVGYQQHAYTDHPEWADLSFTTVMANGYYDFDMGSGLSPYVTAGAGIADVNTADNYVDQTVFAWKVGAGVGVKLASNVTFDLGYQYLSPEGLSSVIHEKVNWAGHNILAGIRYDL
jgi:opacity protein-like surface antigen